VNVFHITVHAGEFRGGPFGQPFAVIDRWLTEVVDPLVKAGKIKWATFSAMADAYVKWEREHPGVDPRSGAAAQGTPSPQRAGGQPQTRSDVPTGYIFGPEAWQFVYLEPRTRRPLRPPYDLNAPDRSRPRSPEEQERLWKAYEELVAYAAANLRAVTSEDIVALAKKNVN
jgi:hypothetical protein